MDGLGLLAVAVLLSCQDDSDAMYDVQCNGWLTTLCGAGV